MLKTSRAICAVVTASRTLWQPAVGQHRHGQAFEQPQKLLPALVAAIPAGSDVVTMAGRAARPLCSTAGEGRAVPLAGRQSLAVETRGLCQRFQSRIDSCWRLCDGR